jgi:hypothetical protein
MIVLSSESLRGQVGLWLWKCIIFVLMLCPAAPVIAAKPLRLGEKGAASELKTQKTVEVEPDNIRVQLKQCLREAEKVTCTFLISSLDDDLTVWVTDPLREKSRLIDIDGNAYSSFEIVQFGKSESIAMLVKQVPIRLILSFTKLPNRISGAALLELGLETYGHEIPVRFQKVEFLNALAPEEPLPKTEEEPTQPEPGQPEPPQPEPSSPPEAPELPPEEVTPDNPSQNTEPPSEEAPPDGSSQDTELPEETQPGGEATDKTETEPSDVKPSEDSGGTPKEPPKEETAPETEPSESTDGAAPTEPNGKTGDTANPEEAPAGDETEPKNTPENPPVPAPSPTPTPPSQEPPASQ